MMNKILTIIVPSYNMEAYLPKCLGSLIVAPELMERLEVLVVNDGSKDRTSEIAHEFAGKWPQTFKVIDKENGHYGSCINAGLPLAKGEFVRVLDADDSVDTDNFAGLIQFLENNGTKNDLDLVISDMIVENPEGRVLERYSFSLGDGVYSLDDYSDRIFNGCSIHILNFRRRIFKKITYKQTEGLPYTDLEWCSLPMSQVERVMFYGKPVIRYLRGREGQSFDPKIIKRDCLKRIQVIENMVVSYYENVDKFLPTAKRYMRGRLLNRLKLGYSSMWEANLDFAQYDDFLRLHAPDFYEELSQLTAGSKIKLQYVKEWRKARSLSTLKIRLFRFLSFLKGHMCLFRRKG